jgi:hypothetical protein
MPGKKNRETPAYVEYYLIYFSSLLLLYKVTSIKDSVVPDHRTLIRRG